MAKVISPRTQPDDPTIYYDRKLIKKANFKTQCVHAGELVDKVMGALFHHFIWPLRINLVMLR